AVCSADVSSSGTRSDQSSPQLEQGWRWASGAAADNRPHALPTGAADEHPIGFAAGTNAVGDASYRLAS
ncbi:hypothetical protein, partial [Silvimonas sp.]|uniref:hypothetical protein n=1 Tax=Silvimonas sp. TaxID=2650811 RepID=UPI00284F7CD3